VAVERPWQTTPHHGVDVVKIVKLQFAPKKEQKRGVTWNLELWRELAYDRKWYRSTYRA
jgi:hypothetical protein